MFDVGSTELLMVGLVALVVIGPKDLPKAMRVVGYWVGKARGLARQLRSGFDDIVRESELADLEKKWADENARIMRDFPGIDGSGERPPGDTTAGDHVMKPLVPPLAEAGDSPASAAADDEPLLPGMDEDTDAPPRAPEASTAAKSPTAKSDERGT